MKKHFALYRKIYSVRQRGVNILLISLLILFLVQPVLAMNLKERFKDTDALIMVADPFSGKLLAEVNLDSFSEEYLPGSIFKLLSALAILEEGLDNEVVDCDYYYPGYDRILRCTYGGGHGKIGFKEALVHSCNYYFYRQAELIDPEKLLSLIGLFKDDKMPLQVPERPAYDLLIGLDKACLMPPIQIMEMAMALANGGIIYELKREGEGLKIKGVLPLSPSHFVTLRTIMEEVVEKGTGQEAKILDLKLGGKTGTTTSGGWFLGIFPLPRPEYVVLIFSPKGTASEKAAPLAKEVIEYFLLSH